MEIKAVKFRRGGFYTQPVAFGGEEGPEKFDRNVRYRGSLQNYLIDTGDEVILVDTGLPAGTPEEVPDENSFVFTGKDICSYMEAFAALGYKPEQVTKILLTHRHSDHSGELKSFPNAKIYVNAEETSATELQGLANIVPVTFTDGAYYNFPESQIIIPGAGGLISPEVEWFPELYEGEHTFGDMTMVISRGLGNSVLPVRINDYPELVVVKVK